MGKHLNHLRLVYITPISYQAFPLTVCKLCCLPLRRCILAIDRCSAGCVEVKLKSKHCFCGIFVVFVFRGELKKTKLKLMLFCNIAINQETAFLSSIAEMKKS